MSEHIHHPIPTPGMRTEDEIRMFLPEDLSRIRRHELIAEAQRHRLARRVSAGRWWRRLGHFALARADRAAARW
ncbi:hypothetical protein [Saccharopolyspora rosea]|uniref:Uncharacterized protein n=1 Tax=Saccharopolyspora rosea TaxID=524884 RepID=A0ABW3FME0_9PSEU|nr:hypothetical protein [Saccharopolyspora rosea]